MAPKPVSNSLINFRFQGQVQVQRITRINELRVYGPQTGV